MTRIEKRHSELSSDFTMYSSAVLAVYSTGLVVTPLLRIAPELRTRAFSMAMIDNEAVDVTSNLRPPPLLETCKLIRAESFGLWLNCQTFHFAIDDCDASQVNNSRTTTRHERKQSELRRSSFSVDGLVTASLLFLLFQSDWTPTGRPRIRNKDFYTQPTHQLYTCRALSSVWLPFLRWWHVFRASTTTVTMPAGS